MQTTMEYFTGAEFSDFLLSQGVILVLSTMVLSFLALLLEVRLPLKYYWGLPGFSARSVLQGFGLVRKRPVWGVCVNHDTGKPLPLVACELLAETTKKPVATTYSNHRGEYGFALQPGRYLLRAVKTRYRLPSLFDPENIEIYEVDESFAVSVIVLNTEVAPRIDLPLVPVVRMADLNPAQSFWHYLRMFLFQLANTFLALDIIVALVGFAVTREPFFGVIIGVCLVLLFIKLYILETISTVERASHA